MSYRQVGELEDLFDDAPVYETARRIVERVGDRLLELVRELSPVYVDSFGDRTNRTPGTFKASWVEHELRSRGPMMFSVTVENMDSMACVLGRTTPVRTRRGELPIAQVKVGDEVLTQTGDYRRVLVVHRARATDHPEMVDLTYPGRNGKDTGLTVTAAHKLLVWRDGRNCWARAADLRDGDEVYQARCHAHNKGTGRRRTPRICVNCGRSYGDVPNPRKECGSKYCSRPCRDEHFARVNPHRGMKRSEAARAKMRQRWAERAYTGPLWRGVRGSRTDIERQVEDWLRGRGVRYVTQARIGRRVVDFYLPDTHEVLEADGAYFHRDQAVDVQRDEALMARDPRLTVTHLHFFDARHSPQLDAAPLPGVRYVACNPGPRSFVEPDAFRRVPVTMRAWTYRPPPRGPAALVYDLTVEGIHSYVCKGLVVSNSHIEFATSPHRIAPKPERGPHARLRFRGKAGNVIYAREVHHPGTKGAHVVPRALAILEGEWPRIAREEITRQRTRA